jgi:hypothetical protein
MNPELVADYSSKMFYRYYLRRRMHRREQLRRC